MQVKHITAIGPDYVGVLLGLMLALGSATCVQDDPAAEGRVSRASGKLVPYG